MNQNIDIRSFYSKHPNFQKVTQIISSGNSGNYYINGLKASAASLFIGNIAEKFTNTQLIIFPDYERASYFASDLIQFLDSTKVHFFPSSYKHPGQSTLTDSVNVLQRSEVLNFFSRKPNHYTFIVTYGEAIAEMVVAQQTITKHTLQLSKGEKIDVSFLKETLQEYGFERVDFVYEPGQYAIRGSIIDVFSFAARFPYRIDFFGNEVESIRSFDVESQLSIDSIEKIYILPNIKQVETQSNVELLSDYLPDDTIIWLFDEQQVYDSINQLNNSPWHKYSGDDESLSNEILPNLATSEQFSTSMQKKLVFKVISNQNISDIQTIGFNVSPQSLFHKNFELLANHLIENQQAGYTNIICSENEKQLERLQNIFASVNSSVKFRVLKIGLHEGFIDHDLKICIYTDHQIFERYHRSRIEREVRHNTKRIFTEITDLHPGDYVVHVDHGIGIFGGIEKVEINGRWQEVIKLVYKDNDVLYVGVNSLHRISKYRGKDSEPPKIYKLGSGAWNKLKQTTKKKIKDISKELIALYAQRMETKGFAFSPDSYLQQELEASFMYEDTPDQEKATRLVKQAMESEHPCDILVCGDVGFGKTEIAIRAAFKAAADNKQTVVLVPTTILALQHYKTFSERLKNFPVTVDYISRTRKPSEIREIFKKVEKGEIDILIGTHKLLNSQIKYKDLGLLIIDEEQKFGVAMKEKLRALKVNIDTITLTATPIPRTLQFSLMGARDLAIINTPPPNRYPVITEVHTFNEEIIREGILNELSRGGQVFFINNRIQNIYDLQIQLKKIVPEARVVVTHGQMDGEQLENALVAFINGDYDVLLTTAIIESGIDIPNANTIFIMDAHHFGLSDLHQLRGRVGRSNKKAFCYLLVPPFSYLTPEARRRLKAIEDYSDLGSGLNIAMLDLDIRGAGNLLGSEQSGFIAEIGYETYLRILQEAVQEVKEEEFAHLFFTEKQTTNNEKPEFANINNLSYVTDCQVDTDFEIMIPESYVENITERIRLYRELDQITNEHELHQFEKQLVDRFGAIPEPVIQLMNVVRLRWLAVQLGIERITIRNEKMVIFFVSNPNSPFYQSEVFGNILKYVQQNPRIFSFKEGKEKLALNASGIKSIKMAIELLQKLNAQQLENVKT